MKWIRVGERVPDFDVPVLVFCRIYGFYIATFKRIAPDCDIGNWHDGESLGVLPPTHWAYCRSRRKTKLTLDKQRRGND